MVGFVMGDGEDIHICLFIYLFLAKTSFKPHACAELHGVTGMLWGALERFG